MRRKRAWKSSRRFYRGLGICLVLFSSIVVAGIAYAQKLAAAQHLQQAMILLQSGQTEEARGRFQDILAEDQEQGQAWYGLGLAQRALGQSRQAITALREAHRLQPQQPEVLFSLGDTEVALHDIYHKTAAGQNEAVIVLRDYTIHCPGDPRGWLRLAQAAAQNNQAADAVSAIDHYLQTNPLDPTALLLKTDQESVTGAPPSVVEADAQRCLQSGPPTSYLYLLLGRAQLALGQTPQAIASLTQAIRIAPTPFERRAPLYVRSLAYRKQGEIMLANADAAESLRLNQARLAQKLIELKSSTASPGSL